MMTKRQVRKPKSPYSYPLRCPNCNTTESEMLDAGTRMEAEGTRYPVFIKTLECELCGLVWDEAFKFVRWDRVEGPEIGGD